MVEVARPISFATLSLPIMLFVLQLVVPISEFTSGYVEFPARLIPAKVLPIVRLRYLFSEFAPAAELGVVTAFC